MNDNLSELQSELARLNTKIIQMAWKISDVEKAVNKEVFKDCQSSIVDMKNRLVELDGRINEVYGKISDIENRFEESDAESLQQIPGTNLISHSLWKRMWAVFGHGVLLYGLLAFLLYTLLTQVF
jgi:chromosome segregation ATPase